MSRVEIFSRRRDAIDGVEGCETRFLDLAKDVFAFAGGLIEGNFLDEEIFVPLLDGPADAGEVMREIGKRHMGCLYSFAGGIAMFALSGTF